MWWEGTAIYLYDMIAISFGIYKEHERRVMTFRDTSQQILAHLFLTVLNGMCADLE